MHDRKCVRCRILAIGDFPEGGAVSQRLYLLTKLLHKGLGNAELWLLHPTSKVALPENEATEGVWQGVRFRYLSCSTLRPASAFGAFRDTLAGILGCVKELWGARNRPDVLVLYTPLFFKFIGPMVLAKLLGIPVVVEACEIPSTLLDKQAFGWVRRLANSGESLMEYLIPRFAQGLLPISLRIQEYYRQRGLADDASYLLPALIDYEFYQTSGRNAVEVLRGQRFFLNSGTFTEKDGLPYLISAVSRVRVNYPDIKLVFTGAPRPEMRERLLNIAGDDAAEWIVFTGFLSRDQLVWCYKHAVGLLSCRSNSLFANFGFPTKLAEYLASATPVVATRVGDVEEYLTDGKNAFLASPENVESIAGALKRLLADPAAAASIGIAGNEVAEKFFDYSVHVAPLADFVSRRIG